MSESQNNPCLQFGEDSLILANNHILLRIETGNYVNPSTLLDRTMGRFYADIDYQYDILIDRKFRSRKLKLDNFLSRTLPDNSIRITFFGRPVFTGKNAPNDILICHTLTMPPDRPYFEERIAVMNNGSQTRKVDDMRFGFRKRLFGGKKAKGFSRIKLYSLPFQRYWGQRLDRKCDFFTMRGIAAGKAPGYASEGWIFTVRIPPLCPHILELK